MIVRQVKNIWVDADHAWKDIDDIFPTAAKPWEDENDPSGNYSFRTRRKLI